MSWDTAARLADKHANQGSLFVRLASNGDKIVGAFCGEPFAREVVWTGERYETYDPSAHPDKRPSLRVMLNFYVPQDGEMKVIEGGTTWFRDVLKVRDNYGLDQWLFEIERHGEAGDPKTTYSILPEERLDDALQARITEAGLHDLATLVGGEGATTGSSIQEAPADGPIDLRSAHEIANRLKELSRPDVDTFLDEFGIKRVRDLKASDVPAARALIDRLIAEQQLDGGGSIDPFA